MTDHLGNLKTENTTVLIVGSGPVGATYARLLVDAKHKVTMIDMGPQERPIIGHHLKNSLAAQKNINKFMDVIKGQLEPLSVEVGGFATPELEASSYTPDDPIVQLGANPKQKPHENLRASAATRAVGGMSVHWTCCTPRQHKTHERSNLFDDTQWDTLYKKAEELLGTNTTSFDNSKRQKAILDALEKRFGQGKFKAMPLACSRPKPNKSYVEWASTATILGEDIANKRSSNFELRSEHQCMKLVRSSDTGNIQYAVVRDLLKDECYKIEAERYVVCAGAVLTPGLLFNSGFKQDKLPALGHYLTEQCLAFCQVVLKKSVVDAASVNPAPADPAPTDPAPVNGASSCEKDSLIKKNYPNDPIKIPWDDPDPQIYMPVSDDVKWHAQVHRDAFSYGQTPPGIDQRLVLDLRFFSPVEPEYHNWVEFTNEYCDAYGMPQPTFHFKLGEKDVELADQMMDDMTKTARHLGGWMPGSEPKFLSRGTALHVCGTTRAGKNTEEGRKSSVVSESSQVWDCKNLYLGGCNVIPTPSASNPTLTAMCFAIEGTNHIIESLKSS